MKHIYAELRATWKNDYIYTDYIEGSLGNVVEETFNNALYDVNECLLLDVNNFVLVASEE